MAVATVQTVRGPIDSSQLGVMLVHEHLCPGGSPFGTVPRFEKQAMDYQATLAERAAAVGINTIVDCGPFPDLPKIIELAERVPQLNYVLSTGAYGKGVGPAWIQELDEAGMEEHMVHNVTLGYEGFEDTGIRAGVIKVAGNRSDVTEDEWEAKNFRAAARAQARCRVPIVTHACTGARSQMELLRAHEAKIAATFYSHVEAEFGWESRTLAEEVDYLSDVASAGGMLQFNNFDFAFDTPWEDMLHLLRALEARGLGGNILMSIDANWTFDEGGHIWHEAEKHHPETGKRTYAYMITHAVPMLLAEGFSLQQMMKYLVENPRRLFEAAA
jgi:phosphotriesterase-related protein